jgi:hypothetical protein
MKRFAVALSLLLATTVAWAAPTNDEQVDRLLQVMRAEQTLATVGAQIEATQKQMVDQVLAGQEVTPEQRQRIDAVLKKSGAQMKDLLTWEKWQPLYRDIYRQTFSAEDMDAMIAFYGSPAGQAVLDKMPALMQNTMVAMQKLLAPVLQDMQRDLQEQAAAKDTVPAK